MPSRISFSNASKVSSCLTDKSTATDSFIAMILSSIACCRSRFSLRISARILSSWRKRALPNVAWSRDIDLLEVN